MRDGAKLIADRYIPQTPPPHPTILIRTPYGRNAAAGAFGLMTDFCARRFAEQGYGVVVQDVRGRFDSGSAFEPFRFEREDGWDTLTWLSERDWCGPIGMWGSSYLGIVQWAAADHPAVRALMPMITASDVYDVAFHDGVFNLDLGARWIAILNLQERYKRRPLLSSAALVTGVERSARRAFQHLPLIEADDALPPGTVRYYQTWLNEHRDGENLRRYFPTPAIEKVTAPVLLVGGWYDFFLRALLKDYAALRAAGGAPQMVIGNWVHFSYAFLMLNTLGMAVRWFDETLNAGARPSAEKPRKPVRLFMLGSRRWREYDAFPPPHQARCWYLDGGGRLDVVPGSAAPETFTFDPASPPPIAGGAQFSLRAGAASNAEMERRPDVLVHTSPGMAAPLEIVGPVRLALYVHSAPCETADFFARLCVVNKQGTSVNLCDGLIRAAAACGEGQSDGSLRVEIDLGATAYRFEKGDRIRLVIAGSGHPLWTRHTGGADPIRDTTLTPIVQTVYHDAAHPSALTLPVIV
ncbi:MAG: CocE/NonD family hydrolase [Anaerolineae bacterium]|nr:CocE/NonD family hydrolase [Anaerolineae bacterium]NUQ04393.1 CocE/NonD family hydrolase [Anaerolineae bacterium]